MTKFLCLHTLPPNAFTRQQIDQFAKAGQQDPKVKGYRSFMSIGEGKAVCIMEAAEKKEVSAWFQKMGMPVDSITKLELEGDRGKILQA